MKQMIWKIVLTDTNQIMILENGNIPVTTIEGQLTIIGILENLKQQHLNKLNTQFEKNIKKNKDDNGL